MASNEKGDNKWVPFDQQRDTDPKIKRADIVFGPDQFDPRINDTSRPFSEAVEEGRTPLSPSDMSRTTGEVYGTTDFAELRTRLREDIRNIQERSVANQPRKGLLKMLLTFIR